HFERHIREMRKTYLARQQHLVSESRRYLADRIRIEPADAGMFLIGWLRGGDDDAAIADRIRAEGVEVVPVSGIGIENRAPPGLLLGYSGVNPAEITAGVQTIARAMEKYDRRA